MKILIHDHKADDPGSWKTTLTRLAGQHGIEIVRSETDTPRIDYVRGLPDVRSIIVFLHSDQWQDWDSAQSSSNDRLEAVVVHIGTSGFSGKTLEIPGRRYVSRFSASRFVESGQGDAFFRSLLAGAPNWRLINPVPTAELLALRILCEAWVMNDGRQDRSHDGVVIHAPVHADDWFDPFLDGFRQLKDGNKAKQAAAREGIEGISAMMGDAQEEVRTFLNRVAEQYDKEVGQLAPKEFDEPIKKLHAKLKESDA